ncbi:MAG: ABC transporter permease, partial [Planctomycetia bacterium]
MPRPRFFDPAVVAAAAFLAVATIGAILAPILPLADPDVQSTVDRLKAPSATHWFGTDDLGRDVFSRTVYGGRASLWVGVLAVVLAFAVGTPLGVAAGFTGGWVDRVLTGVVEVMLTFPSILLALVVTAVLGPSLENVMLSVAAAQAPQYARQARAGALAVRDLEFVKAAWAMGATPFRLMTSHVLPNILPPLLAVATMGLGGAILD